MVAETIIDHTTTYQQTADTVIANLASNAQNGLSSTEAQTRLQNDGPNELASQKPTPAWHKFLAQFQDTLVILLLIATIISVGIWLYERDQALPYEGIAIFAIVLFNGILGYVQEARAEQAVAALRAMSAAKATVLRNGERQSIPATNLVPGDILLIEEGDTVPADARLIHSTALQTSEASLTGESLPVSKNIQPIEKEVSLGDRHNMLFSGTAITYGRGRAIVTATGMQTEMGKIAGLLEQTEDETTPLQRQLDQTGRLLGVIVLVIAVVIVITIILIEGVRELSAMVDVLIFGVALAVAAVPEGLPAVVTAVLAIGIQRMAKRNAIVRQLPAVETLGASTVIATDKTGTLTKNEMTVRTIVTASGRVDMSGSGYTPDGAIRQNGHQLDNAALQAEVERVLRAADRANNAVLQEHNGRWHIQGDPTEGALIVAARKVGLLSEQLDQRFARISEIPFSSERKLMSTIHEDAKKPKRLIVFSKGAPDILLARCTHELVGAETKLLTDQRREVILHTNDQLASEALRTLGIAFRSLPHEAFVQTLDDQIEHGLVFLGICGMIDPPRPEVRDAVVQAQRAGIRPIMITGDHPQTAIAIARELGISSNNTAIIGTQLQQYTDTELDQIVRDVSVYARVNPEHKLHIVDSLQRSGAVVAMTGDGVNDAPALKAADIGVAMGITGTDVSKEAADVVLADDNFATIVAAVEEGRAIFSNIQKFLRYLLSSNIGEVLTMFLGIVLAGILGLTGEGAAVVLPLLATQILWINLVTDGAPALALGVDPANPHTMQRHPRPRGSPVITRQMWIGIVFVGIIMATGTLLMLDFGLPGGLISGTGDLPYARTLAFTTLVLFQLFNVFNARSDERSAFDGLFHSPWLWGGVLLSLLLHLMVIYIPFLQNAFGTIPLSGQDWLRCVAVASTVIWGRELQKLWTRQVSSKINISQQHSV
ncbi:MAG: cation-translocating P-type ATPase [Chloroflexi bacterium AL-W]|nr:cation-translocating P-type ATPase [Chloroflexi bacterium AL-N1]NOK71248.1 cation-translocating P-type ATPase [Chloroflexi bacterium AL-N10]NOK76537.1 cation-translocating P-type ATPase [Chloroflexi bacterium AL-N5]NOK83655.1 cation-translocating P-type ATPase [Chloroflexi bacterium AL-W]NOK92224.1 cation-translocating P-type ATPase [Chloroflexi bacterium AL-N15]